MVVDAAVAPPPVVGVWHHGEIAVASHACALHGRHVWCWGNDTEGQIDGRPGGEHDLPVVVPGVDDAVQIAVEGHSSCAVTSGGEVWCWGSTTPGREAVARVAGVPRAVEVAVSTNHACARVATGDVWCWDPANPSAELHEELGRVTRIVANTSSACAIGQDEHVRCLAWTAGDFLEPLSAQLEVTDARGAVQLEARSEETCAVTRDGRAVCAGRSAAPACRGSTAWSARRCTTRST